WKPKIDAYLDSELPEQEMSIFDAHVRNCPLCSRDGLTRLQLKRAIQVAGKRFAPSPAFRKSIGSSQQRSFRLGWVFTTAAVAVIAAGVLTASIIFQFSSCKNGHFQPA